MNGIYYGKLNITNIFYGTTSILNVFFGNQKIGNWMLIVFKNIDNLYILEIVYISTHFFI